MCNFRLYSLQSMIGFLANYGFVYVLALFARTNLWLLCSHERFNECMVVVTV